MSGFDVPDCMIYAGCMPGFTCETVRFTGGFAVKVMQLKHQCPSHAGASFKALGAERIVAELSAIRKID